MAKQQQIHLPSLLARVGLSTTGIAMEPKCLKGLMKVIFGNERPELEASQRSPFSRPSKSSWCLTGTGSCRLPRCCLSSLTVHPYTVCTSLWAPGKAIISFTKCSRASFYDSSFYDDSLLRPLSSRTEHFRLVVHHCRNSSVLSLLRGLLVLFRCACVSSFSILVQFF
jgi:hypothetical protein